MAVDFKKIIERIENKELVFDLLMSRPQSTQRDERYYDLFEMYRDVAYPQIITIPLESNNRGMYIERDLLSMSLGVIAQRISTEKGFEKHLDDFEALRQSYPASGGTTVNVVPATTATPTPKPAVQTTTPAPVTTTPKEKSYTSAEVAQHADSSSCWTIVRGKVYDLTSFTNQHDGGAQAILSLCGIDGTAGFEDQHSGQRRPQNELTGLYIGVLSN